MTQVLAGSIVTPLGTLRFPPDAQGRHAPFHISLLPEGLEAQRRISLLRITGSDPPQIIHQGEIDWEIKAALEPFDGLIELLDEFRLLPFVWGANQIEFVATSAAEIDPKSTIDGETAQIVVRMAKGLSSEKLRVGYRVRVDRTTIHARGTIPGSDLSWTEAEYVNEGRYDMKVPRTAAVNAVTVYDGVALHHWWFADPNASPNPRRTVYEAFDPRLELLKDIIDKAQGKGQDSRNFESAVGWILWMLGFEMANIGSTPRTADAPDIIASTAAGNFLVVEVTTGLPKAEHKLANLYERAESARRALKETGREYLKVVPVMVTSKTRADVQVDLEQVDKAGVYLVTGDEFEAILNRTLLMADAQATFVSMEQEIAAAKAKYDQASLSMSALA
jgi:hypothetical protein